MSEDGDSMTSFNELPEEAKNKVAAEVEYFTAILLRRYGLKEADIGEVMESLRWLKEHRQFMARVQQGSMMSILAMLVAAIATTLWAGIKSLVAMGPR
jgi:hypothetical protein